MSHLGRNSTLPHAAPLHSGVPKSNFDFRAINGLPDAEDNARACTVASGVGKLGVDGYQRLGHLMIFGGGGSLSVAGVRCAPNRQHDD